MNNHLHDQRGVAMVLELVLVAAVLGLVGVALYQSSHRGGPAASVTSTPTPAAKAAVSVANAAAAISETESASDANLSATAEDSAGIAAEPDVDITNLGGSASENAY
ncbi:MAG TPA: hypothetical protein VMT30_04865 [Candidatus Saccharimonadia bacterium]|nr:hypothetical protein [Candidatus Saccharimonadia bacterium]